MIHVVQSFAVCQQFRDSVCRSFEWFSSISLSVVVRLQFMVRAGRLVQPVVQLLVQFMIQLIRSFSLCMQLYLSLSLTSSPSSAYQAR